MFDVWEANYAIDLWGMAFCAVGAFCTFLLQAALSLHLCLRIGEAGGSTYRGRPAARA